MSEGAPPPFEEDTPAAADPADRLVLDLAGFEGPIDLLLSLSREQKVDLVHISILALAEQYLAFVQRARERHLDLAAEYLVMAAWLAYLKSRLLLPDRAREEEPSGQEMAEALQFQLQRLEAMQGAGTQLAERARLGRDVFARGAPEGVERVTRSVWDADLYDLLRAYADHRRRQGRATSMTVEAFDLFAVEDAIQRLRRIVGRVPEWTVLSRFLPPDGGEGLRLRSALASTFTAMLEMARQGRVDVEQHDALGPIHVRGRGS